MLPLLSALPRRLLLGLLALGLGVQGLSQAVEQVAAPVHRHVPRPATADALATVASPAPAEARSFARDDHRRIPWIGEGSTISEGHAHDGVAAHAHALADEGVLYVDADEDASGSGAKPAAAAACPLPATPPRVACGASGHAAWRAAEGWHALAMTGEPPERPPR